MVALDFPSNPTIGQKYPASPVAGLPTYTWDGEKWTTVGGTIAGMPAPSTSTPLPDATPGVVGVSTKYAREDHAHPFSTGGFFKNYILNGAMQISQENGTTANTVNAYYPVDAFNVSFSHGGAVSIAQVASPTPAGSGYRLRVVVTTADAAVAAADYMQVNQSIEGLRVADLRCGSAAAKTVTLRFGVKAPAGTYAANIRNAACNRSYVADFVISAGEANVDTVKTVTIPLDTTGTWATDNTSGMGVSLTLMSGTTYRTSAGAWAAGNFIASANQFNFMGTVNNIFELFDVGLYAGSVAPPFVVPDYQEELLKCMRYFQWNKQAEQGHSLGANSSFFPHIPWVPYRATPTVTCPTTVYLECLPWTNGVNVTGASIGGGHMSAMGGDYQIIGTFSPPNSGSNIASGVYGTTIKFNARL